MTYSTLSAFALYLFLIALIGYSTYRRQRSSTDFIIGNRSLNPWVTALSAHASDMSSWLFMGFPAAIMTQGGIQVWAGLGLILGMLCNWQFIAPKLRKETERFGNLTVSTFFESRFHDHSGVLRMIAATLSLLFYVGYICSGLVGMGYLFEAVFGIHKVLGSTIGISIVVLYTLIGGFVTVCWMDFYQALFLLAMLILVPFIAFSYIGGSGVVEQAAEAQQISLSIIPYGGSFLGIGAILLAALGWGLGYFGQPHILIKFMGIEDVRKLRHSKYIGITWQTLTLGAAAAVGFLGIAFFQGQLGNPELVFVKMVQILFHPFIAGFILCAILAATISTMDSQILVLGSVLSEDFYRKLLRRNKISSSKELLWVSRGAVLFVAVLAYLLAIYTTKNVMQLVLYSWAGLGCTFGPVLILALYSKRTNRYGAIAGMLFGGLFALLWPEFFPEIPTLVPGFLLTIPLVYGVSRITHGGWPTQGG